MYNFESICMIFMVIHNLMEASNQIAAYISKLDP